MSSRDLHSGVGKTLWSGTLVVGGIWCFGLYFSWNTTCIQILGWITLCGWICHGILHGKRESRPDGWIMRCAILILLLHVTANIAERTGWIFGTHFYPKGTGPSVGSVPVMATLVWLSLMASVLRMVGGMDEIRSLGRWENRWAVVLMISLVVPFLDMAFQPILHQCEWMVWLDQSDYYHGVPLSRYVGMAECSLILSHIMIWKWKGGVPDPVGAWQSWSLLGILMMAAGVTYARNHQWVPMMIGINTLGAMAWILVSQWKDDVTVPNSDGN